MRSLSMALFITLAMASFAHAQDQSDVLLQSMRQQSLSTKTIYSRFTQEKHLAIFDEVVTSKGYFVFERPQKLRWEYESPFRSGFVFSGDNGKRWDDLTGIQDVDLASDPVMRVVAEQVLAWTTFDLDTLQQQYLIKVKGTVPISLDLTPKSSALASIINHLLIVFADDGKTITTVELHDQDGDFTRLSFYDTQLNQQLPTGTF